MKKMLLFSLMALLMLGMTSCKYDEGPFISFIPKVERISNTWVPNEAVKNGTSSTSIDGFKEITFFKEGACQIIRTSGSTEIGFTGTWVLSDDKMTIHISVVGDLNASSTYVSDWTILRLKEEELKVSYTDSPDTYIVTFEPAV
jgi:hypothetical protein